MPSDPITDALAKSELADTVDDVTEVLKICGKCGGVKVGRRCPVCAKAYTAAWRAANPERARAINAKWRAENPEAAAASSRASRAKNPEKHREACRIWYENNRDKVRESNAAWRSANRDKILAKEATDRETLPDTYVAKLLNMPLSECDPKLIEMKRAAVRLGREVRAIKKRKALKL